MKFSERVLSKLENARGVLISDFDNHHLMKLLNIPDCFNFDFEVDWILCTVQYLVAFQISLSTLSGSLQTTIVNKLEQVLEITIPKLKLALFVILDGYNNPSIYEEFIRQHLKTVIYIPNADQKEISSVLSDLNSCFFKDKVPECMKKFKRMFDAAMKNGYMSYVQLLIHPEFNKTPVLFSLKQDMTLELLDLTVFDLFCCNRKVASEKFPNLEMIASLFCISCIMIDETCLKTEPVDIEERLRQYKPPQNEKKKLDAVKPKYELNQILSLQQCNVLNSTEKFIGLIGEPGSGKTSVMLEKVLFECRDDSTELVFFVIPECKHPFRKYVENFLDDNMDENHRKKVKIVLVDEYNADSLESEIMQSHS